MRPKQIRITNKLVGWVVSGLIEYPDERWRLMSSLGSWIDYERFRDGNAIGSWAATRLMRCAANRKLATGYDLEGLTKDTETILRDWAVPNNEAERYLVERFLGELASEESLHKALKESAANAHEGIEP